MKVFITGVSGFIGGEAARSFYNGGGDVAGLVRESSRIPPDLPIKIYSGSLTDPLSVRRAVKDFQPDTVLHFGAITPVAYSFDHPQEVMETNLGGTINLAEACLREAPSLRRFVFASSMEVYGSATSEMGTHREYGDCLPMCPYAVSKLAAEKYLEYLGMAFGFPWMALRQTNTYGRTRDSRFIVESLVTKMLLGGEVIAGDPRPVRNFIHVSDLLELYSLLAGDVDFERVRGQVFNVGPNNGVSILALSGKIASATNYNGAVSWNRIPPRPGEVWFLNSSESKLFNATGWRPEIDLDTGISMVVNHWSKALKLA